MVSPEIPGKPATPPKATCVTDRTSVYRFTEQSPGTGDVEKSWIPDWNTTSGSTSTSCTPSAKIQPLSNDKDLLKGQIDNYSAGGRTAGALGTAWAWHMISPNWSNIWPSESTPRPYSELTEVHSNGQPKLKKIAILMTDGEYNQYDGAPEFSQQVSAHAEVLCGEMKKTGITIYTVGFQIGNSGHAYDVMSKCASDPSYFYNSTSGEELRQAFRDIALQIATLRISQ